MKFLVLLREWQQQAAGRQIQHYIALDKLQAKSLPLSWTRPIHAPLYTSFAIKCKTAGIDRERPLGASRVRSSRDPNPTMNDTAKWLKKLAGLVLLSEGRLDHEECMRLLPSIFRGDWNDPGSREMAKAISKVKGEATNKLILNVGVAVLW